MPEETKEIVVQNPERELMLAPVMDLKTAKARLAEFQQFIKEYLVEEEDYGVIPGTTKPTLYKPGADKLCELYGLADEYEVVGEYSREDWSAIPPLFDYTIRCVLRSKRSGIAAASGMGSCNSYEGKYRWRDLKRKCPNCGQETVIKGKEEYGGGWICWKKEGRSNGCGMKFSDDDERIANQIVGRIENDDIATLKNTILKMAKKRAKVDATLSATRSSGIFTQDMEDIQPAETHEKKAASGNKQAQVLVTDAQRKELFKVADAHGWTKPILAAWLLGQYGFKSTAEIPSSKFDEIKVRLADQSPKSDKGQPEGPTDVITKDQIKLFWAVVKKQGWTEEEVHTVLKTLGVEHVHLMSKAQLDDVLKHFAKPKAEPERESKGHAQRGFEEF